MSQVKNSRNQIQKANKTNKRPLWLHPILLKGIGSIIMVVFSLLIKYQLPRIVITISNEVCPEQKGNVIKIDFDTRKVTDLEK